MATPSLAMIPSAYADSKVYSVLPNNGDGDFTFNRDSSATRIGQNGLIQTVGYFGNEETTNGNFDGNATGWTLQTGWAYADNKVSKTTSSASYLLQSSILTVGKSYKIKFTMSNYTSGSFGITTAFWNKQALYSANGTYEIEATTSSVNLYLYSDSSFVGSIDNVSVKEVTGDQPRLNYDISNGVVQSCPSLLLEPASTNLIAYSQDFSNYSTVLGIIAESGFTDPSGTTTAYKLSNFANNGSRFDYTTPVTAVNGTTYTYSAYYKGSGTIRINCSTSGGVGGSGEKDIVLTNEWKREEISFTAVNPTGNVKTHTAITRTANNNAIVYLAFTQIEALSYATSYIPTNGASQTRAAETCDGAGTASTFNSTEGVLYAELKALSADGTNRYISLNDGTGSNRVNLFYDTNNVLRGFISGISSMATSATITDNNKVAIKYKSGDIALWLNGVEVGTKTDAISLSGLSSLSFNQLGGLNWYGNVKDIRVYNEALTDAQLQTLTTL